MARQLRVEYPGAIYHVTIRSNGKESLFKTGGDRKYLLARIGEAADRYQVRVYLFCLMSNHFHLVKAAKYRVYVEAGLDTADKDFLGELERSRAQYREREVPVVGGWVLPQSALATRRSGRCLVSADWTASGHRVDSENGGEAGRDRTGIFKGTAA